MRKSGWVGLAEAASVVFGLFGLAASALGGWIIIANLPGELCDGGG